MRSTNSWPVMARQWLLLATLWVVQGESTVHDCDRSCSSHQEPKNCHFIFRISVGSSVSKDGGGPNESRQLLINENSPGPSIVVCENDTVVVDVQNLLPGRELTLHWHGLHQKTSHLMDGVPMITQCPIQPFTTFRYQFQVSKPGTYFYHAYSVTQHSGGLYGALVVRGKSDRYLGTTLLIAPSNHGQPVKDLNIVKVHEDENKRLLRLINAVAINCPFVVRGSVFQVQSVDGSPVKHIEVPEVLLYPGERVDVQVKESDLDELVVTGYSDCQGIVQYLLQPGIPSPQPPQQELPDWTNYYKQLKSAESRALKESAVKLFIPLHLTDLKSIKDEVDFRYMIGESSPYTPAYISFTGSGLKVPQVDHKTFLYPPAPLCSQRQDVPEDLICSLGTKSKNCDVNSNGFCECLQIITLPFNKTVDLYLVNEGFSFADTDVDATQTFHLHGYSFYVLGVGSFDQALTAGQIEMKSKEGRLKLNLDTPVLKDTIVVPSKGYTALRLVTNNPGYWMLRSTQSASWPTSGWEVVLEIPGPDPIPIPTGFPRCNTFKSADLLLAD